MFGYHYYAATCQECGKKFPVGVTHTCQPPDLVEAFIRRYQAWVGETCRGRFELYYAERTRP